MVEQKAREEQKARLTALFDRPEVVEVLRSRARVLLARSSGVRRHDSLSLVNRAVLRVLAIEGVHRAIPAFGSQDEFLAYMIQVMRSVVLDEVRKSAGAARGGVATTSSLEDVEPGLLGAHNDEHSVRQFFEVLAKLGKKRPLAARIVALKYLLDAVWEDVAKELAITVGKAREEWEYARAWLTRELQLDRGA